MLLGSTRTQMIDLMEEKTGQVICCSFDLPAVRASRCDARKTALNSDMGRGPKLVCTPVQMPEVAFAIRVARACCRQELTTSTTTLSLW